MVGTTYHAAYNSFLNAILEGGGGTFFPSSYGSVHKLYWRRTTNAI